MENIYNIYTDDNIYLVFTVIHAVNPKQFIFC